MTAAEMKFAVFYLEMNSIFENAAPSYNNLQFRRF